MGKNSSKVGLCFVISPDDYDRGDALPYSSDHGAIIHGRKMIVFGGRGHASRRDGKPSGEHGDGVHV